MREIEKDAFYDLQKQYDSDREYHFVGEVVYHLLCDDKAYAGPESHREALLFVFDLLAKNSIESQRKAREARGDREDREGKEDRDAREGRDGWGSCAEDQLYPLVYDIDKAQSTPLSPQAFFYCPNILKIDYYGNVTYDAEWKPNDDNFGTTVPYWYAVMEPIHGRNNKPEDFKLVNDVLFPNGTDALDIYEWTTDWSDFFNDGHEWYGACCWSIFDKTLNRYVVMLVSATD